MKKKHDKQIQKKVYKFFKSLFDFLFALNLIVLGSPIFIIIALLIKLSSRGPIFYFQERIGRNNNSFYCIKFRTMHPEADDILENILTNNENLRQEFKATHKIKNDPRVTNIGKILRKTSLDELPQFINVLKGEMSIIGPRPIVGEEKVKYGVNLNKILSISLWQVSGRNNLTYKKRISLDLIYVNQYNFRMDLIILIRTFGVILFPLDRGAY